MSAEATRGDKQHSTAASTQDARQHLQNGVLQEDHEVQNSSAEACSVEVARQVAECPGISALVPKTRLQQDVQSSKATVLESTTDPMEQSTQQQEGQQPEQLQQQEQQQQQQEQHHIPAASSSDQKSVLELQQQLAALMAEKQRVEADRQEMALKQGNYKGTIAQLEGALSFSERKVKDQLAAMEKLQAQVASLTSELQEARGAAAQTPDRCRTAARALQAEADRAATYARSNEAQVKKLKQVVQLGAREMSELLDFAEQERLTLLERETVLQQELNQVRSRAAAAEAAAADALAGSAALEQQLGATKQELAACQSRLAEQAEQLATAAEQLQQAEGNAAALTAERDAAARNLRRAEAELNDVGEYSTKMFRQARFISHMLDKNSALLGKLPDFAGLARDLRAFVAANACNWERRDADMSAATGVRSVSHTAAGAASHMADTAVSGPRDVTGKMRSDVSKGFDI